MKYRNERIIGRKFCLHENSATTEIERKDYFLFWMGGHFRQHGIATSKCKKSVYDVGQVSCT